MWMNVLFSDMSNIRCDDIIYRYKHHLWWLNSHDRSHTNTKTFFKIKRINRLIWYAKYQLTNKLLNYDLILGRDILHGLGIIFNFKNKTITWQEVSISIKPPNCTEKEFFVIKE